MPFTIDHFPFRPASFSGLAPALALIAACVGAPACLVVSVHPAYEEDGRGSIVWEPALVGGWRNADDNASMRIDRAEWHSYRIHYVHPIETGDLTGYLTSIGDARYLDLMPARGADRGSFVVPVHTVVRVRLEGDRLELTPLSYDWFSYRLRAGAVAGLHVVRDARENALILSPTRRLRTWLAAQPADGRMFGASAVFTRTAQTPGLTMLKGTRPALVKKIQPVSIHGQISLDVYFVDPEDPEGQVSRARIGEESVPRDIEAGQEVTLHYVLGVVTQITKQAPKT